MRTGFRHRLHVSAVVTHQLVADFVIRHRYAAIGAINRLITGAAANHGMIAPPIQQQQHLFAMRKRFLHRIQQCIAEWCPIAQLPFPVHVYNCNFRQWHIAIPFLQFQQRINALFGIVVAFNGWRCRCQQQRTVMGLTAFPSNCNRMIARSVFRFIRPFALFIDNQNAQILHGSKHRTACTDRNLCRSILHTLIGILSLSVGQSTMHDNDCISEQTLKLPDNLRC